MKRRLETFPTEQAFSHSWKAAIASIRDQNECPMYSGLEIAVTEDLFPIGRDPKSRLWEFVHLRSGAVPERRGGRLKVTHESGLVLVLLPGGQYVMGSPKEEELRSNHEQQHRVSLSPFLIAKHETRQAVWERVTGTNPSSFKAEALPVEFVTWEECREFTKKLGLSLPSEAQWEYACRAGTTGPYGGTGNLAEMGWYEENSERTHPVGEKKANAFGLFDMHGNVHEWCEDVFDPSYFDKAEARGPDPVATSGSKYRTCRGSGWESIARKCRSAYRGWIHPTGHDSFLGFRPALRVTKE